MLPVFERITPAEGAKQFFDRLMSDRSLKMALEALTKYHDELDNQTRQNLGAVQSRTRIKGLRAVARLEHVLERGFYVSTSIRMAKAEIKRHLYYGTLRRQDITVPLRLSAPDLRYVELVEFSRRLDEIEHERESNRAMTLHRPNCHRRSRHQHQMA